MDSLRNNVRVSDEAEDGGVELSLGLSLNGRFGFDPTRISRSSSVSSFPAVANIPVAVENIPARAYSLPTAAAAEGWRKRKEEQALRRLEAKRRMLDKMRRRSPRSSINGGAYSEENSNSSQGTEVNGGVIGDGSQGSSSSAISELTILPNKASQPAQQSNEPKQPVRMVPKPRVNTAAAAQKKAMALKQLMMEMPSVTTVGKGPNGREVNGFLYKYGRGEEVTIMCVCHGSFMSPEEFIRHAGGEGVANPMKHIVVNHRLVV